MCSAHRLLRFAEARKCYRSLCLRNQQASVCCLAGPCYKLAVHAVHCTATNLSLIGAAASLRELLLELWFFLQRPHIDLRSIDCGRPHEVRQDLCKSIQSSLLATCKPTAHRIRAPPAYSFHDCWLPDICRSTRQQAKQESWAVYGDQSWCIHKQCNACIRLPDFASRCYSKVQTDCSVHISPATSLLVVSCVTRVLAAISPYTSTVVLPCACDMRQRLCTKNCPVYMIHL